MDGQVVRQNSSYRQGLVLGLTMAEIMLLLIFCLLIAMAAFLKKEHDARMGAENKVAEQQQKLVIQQAKIESQDKAISVLREKSETNASKPPNKEAGENWRELVESHAVMSAFKKAGLTAEDVEERVAGYTALLDKGLDKDSAFNNADIVGSIAKHMTFPKSPAKFPKDFIAAFKRTMDEKGTATGHQWPPIIKLSEAEGYYFNVGSAELRPEFFRALTEDTPKEILQLIKEYGVDIIEVVGHTDEQPLGGIRQTNLDRMLVPILKGQALVGALVPADNAGLGLARAVSVVSVLRQSTELKNYKLVPLSGAQLVNNDETLALAGSPGDIKERRRIEIRLRKSTPHEAAAKLEPVVMPAAQPQRPRPRPQPAPINQGTTPMILTPSWFAPLPRT